MTYGWALLIIAIVAIALWRLGVFTPMAKEQVLNDFLYFTTGAFKLVNGDTFQIEVTNTRVGSAANITSVTVETAFATQTNNTVNLVLEEGGTGIIVVSMSGTSCEVGKVYTADVTIHYYKRLPNGNWATVESTDTAKINVLCRSA